MNIIWFWIGIAFAFLNIYSLWRKNRNLEGVVKPATMLFLIVGLLTTGLGMGQFPRSMTYFIAGAIFCLIGDIFLWLPPERYFRVGLIAFLLGHIGYILGFGWISEAKEQIGPLVLLLLILAMVSSRIGIRIIQSLRKTNRDQLVAPIAVYSFVISVMLFLAGIRLFDDAWSVSAGLLVAFGAFSFYVSDVLNAWTRFVSKLSHDRIIIMGLYHLGQFMIAFGVLQHFLYS
ncbi:lysoplasmalogenase [bacterium]|nr:lysoplasmalogenase [bacterium]